MVARRMLALMAVLMGLMLVAAAIAPPPPRGTAVNEPRVAPPTPSGTTGSEVALTIDATTPEAETVTVAEGEIVRLTIEARREDSVELVGLARITPVSPELPAVFDVYADTPGSYPVTFVSDGRTVGTLEVTPAEA